MVDDLAVMPSLSLNDLRFHLMEPTLLPASLKHDGDTLRIYTRSSLTSSRFSFANTDVIDATVGTERLPHYLIDTPPRTPSPSFEKQQGSLSPLDVDDDHLATTAIIKAAPLPFPQVIIPVASKVAHYNPSFVNSMLTVVPPSSRQIGVSDVKNKTDSPALIKVANMDKPRRCYYPLHKHYESDLGGRLSGLGTVLQLTASVVEDILTGTKGPLVIICPAVRLRDCATILTHGFGYEQKKFVPIGVQITGKVEIWTVLTRCAGRTQIFFEPHIKHLHPSDILRNMKALPTIWEFDDMKTIERFLAFDKYKNSHVLFMGDNGMTNTNKAFVKSLELIQKLGF
jgi:hypothetical protein